MCSLKFNIGGELKDNIFKIKKYEFRKEKGMNKLFQFVCKNRDFEIELFKNENLTESSIVYKLVFSTNSEDIVIESESDNPFEIFGVLFDNIEEYGKIIEVKFNGLTIFEDDIIKVFFNYETLMATIRTKNCIHEVKLNELDIETITFGEESILELRNEVNKFYKKVA
jgi:hypothetical protein